jgi:hypothetical protein
MEASGVADATWTARVAIHVEPVIIAIDKADTWHFYASVIAAAYTPEPY